MVISSWGRPCGVGEYGRALVEAMRDLGHAPAVIPMGPAAAVARVRALGLDLVHFQYEYNLMDAGELAAAVTALARSGVPSVVTVHSWSPEARYANGILAAMPCLFVVTMPALRLALVRAGIAGARVAVLPIGIPSYPLPPRAQARAQLGLDGEPAVGFFGFYHRHKGIASLALAGRILRERYPGLRCFVFATAAPNEGSRRAREEVLSFLDAHRLWDAVTVTEEYLPEEEIVRRLHAMDVNVLPYAELAGVQASAAVRTVLAARRPTVVTETAHFSDLGREVCKIADNRPERIAAAIAEVLEDAGKAQALVERVARLADRQSWVRVAAAHWRCYEAALAARGVGGAW